MIPFYLLVVSWLALRGAGSLGVARWKSWTATGRIALAAMFMFTGTTHFTPMHDDYRAMIPAGLPHGSGVIYLTGALEIVGAIGLVVPRVRPFAAVCLGLLMLAVFPANVYAWSAQIPFGGRSPTPLWIRAPVQLFFLAALWFAAIRSKPGTSDP